MGRKRATLLNYNVEDIDSCLQVVLDDARAQFGEDRIFTGKESEARLVGIQLPALSLRYLYQCNILPLSRVEQIVGTQESCKSAFLYEKYRWIRCNGGKSYHVEVESKDSDALRMSILNYDRPAVDLLIAESLEDWQKYLTYLLRSDSIKAQLLGTKEKPGPGKTVPIGFGVDSLTSKASLEIQESMEKQGFAGRMHPIDALKISSYLKCMPQKLVGWPFWFGAINHLKPSGGQGSPINYHVPGGYSVKFQETFETRMSRVTDIDQVEEQGVQIKFVTQKNSLGPGRKMIMADFRWFFDKDGRQHSYWDWNSATIRLLDEQLKGSLRTAALDIVDLHTTTKGGKRVWSKALDVPKDNPVPYAVAGALLEKRPDLLDGLHKLLGVRTYTVFKPGVDYSTQLKDAAVAIEREQGYEPVYTEGEAQIAEEAHEELDER
jgi:hypothetical protein